MTTILNRGASADFSEYRLKHAAPQAILQAAIPRRIALRLDDDPRGKLTSVTDLTTGERRIIPEWPAKEWSNGV